MRPPEGMTADIGVWRPPATHRGMPLFLPVLVAILAVVIILPFVVVPQSPPTPNVFRFTVLTWVHAPAMVTADRTYYAWDVLSAPTDAYYYAYDANGQQYAIHYEQGPAPPLSFNAPDLSANAWSIQGIVAGAVLASYTTAGITITCRETAGKFVLSFLEQGNDFCIGGQSTVQYDNGSLVKEEYTGTAVLEHDWSLGAWSPSAGLFYQYPAGTIALGNGSISVLVLVPFYDASIPEFPIATLPLAVVAVAGLIILRGRVR